MLFFAVELDDERILQDDILNLDAAYKTIENTFAQKDVTLCYKDGNVRYYTRNIDKNDFAYLWMVNALFRKASWFQYYVKTWKFIDMDDDTNEIYEEEDLMESEWVKRPEKP